MPIQKSFSDQNHSAKAKQNQAPFRRNKSFQAQPTGNAISKPLQEKPPIPVSTATKNKLNGFQFEGNASRERTTKTSKPVINLISDDEKENEGAPAAKSVKTLVKKTKHLISDEEKENGGVSLAKPVRDLAKTKHLMSDEDTDNVGASRKNFVEAVTKKVKLAKQPSQDHPIAPVASHEMLPSTPAARLALPDLIGMEDIRREVKNVTPEERLEWDHDRDMSSATQFPGLRRVRKRARSSSPIGSSPARASAHFATKGESLNQQVDPGSDLWGRYSTSGSAVPTPRGQPIPPSLAHLMQTSSPQTLKEGGVPRTAGFRRSNSCGNQFPKRRKVEGDDVFAGGLAIGPSRLSVLIERVQEGLSQAPKADTKSRSSQESSSSENTSSENKSQTPTHRGHRPSDKMASLAIDMPGLVTIRTGEADNLHTIAEVQPSRGSSDYGDFDDDDLDEDLLAAVESKSEKIIIEPAFKVPPDDRRQTHAMTKGPVSFSAHKMPMPPGPSTKQKGRGEFDDSDDDEGMTADLENILSQFDVNSSVKKARISPRKTAISKPSRRESLTIADSDDEFGDGDLDDVDFDAAEATATQSIQQSANSLIPSTQKPKAIQRYLITLIQENEYVTPHGRTQHEKILFLQVENTKLNKTVHLRGTWFETSVTVKAFVHVIGLFDKNNRCVIDDNTNLLILHPDHLISATVVADSFGCTRRAVLQDRVKATSDSSAPLIYGTILHEIFQAAMLANRWDIEWLQDRIEKVANQHLEDLYTIRLEVPHAVDYLLTKMPELQSWAELFVSSRPNPGASVKAGNGEIANMCVSKLLDVEEHVWSPMYGLKGNIDATVQVTMQDAGSRKVLTVPFEVKTGKNPSAAHRAQTALYNLLLSDRYDIQIAYGILYYMETSETIRIPAIRHELRHMIMQRNELACFVRERHAQLPPMLKKDNMCNRCYAKVPCFIYHRLADDGTSETSGVGTKFDEVVKHLTPKHKEFFLKWDDLLTKEEKESLKFRRELWTMLSLEREKLGRCFANVIIEPGSAYEDVNNPKINRYRYSMIKETPNPGFSFLDSQIIVGEPIVISDEKGHFALANGFVTHVRRRRVTVAVDRRLHNARIRKPGFDEENNQVFASIMEVAPEGSSQGEAEGKIVEAPIRFRLDKDEFSNGMATVRNNLIQVMADGPWGSRQIRGLVVDLNAPRFKTTSTSYVLRDSDSINDDQRRAIQKVMSAEDYALVLGMPGTGKTTTIAHIIRALVSQGKSVLLTSYTHTAVDNILLKLKDDNIPILRLGTIGKISMEVQEFATLGATVKTSFGEIKSAWHDSPIVATTCLGINHALFRERNFDYCIVDEASQITLPVCVGPIRLAKTFILVGDHNQLPPLVRNEEARIGGLDISLFKHLSDTNPSSVVYLEHQYRMCEDVMALSNNLIYNGRLKCGSQEVADRSIVIPNMEGLKVHHFSPSTLPRTQKSFCIGPSAGRCWLRHLVNPTIKVSFINTDPLLPASKEEAKGNRIVNPTEAAICVQLVEALLSVGVLADSIGVMTHYRSQLALLKDGLRKHPDVEMHTADRFQGRDKEVIILSLVRSNEAKSIGELLKDWRRINVAFTRAKTKLLVVGSRETLKGNGPNANGEEEMVARFVQLMESKDWIFNLPADALSQHVFEKESTQTQATASARSGPSGSQRQKSKIKNEYKEIKTDLETEMEDVVFVAEKKRKALGPPQVGKENIHPGLGNVGFGVTGKQGRVPNKRVLGQKPFKIPAMGVLRDVVNETLG